MESGFAGNGMCRLRGTSYIISGQGVLLPLIVLLLSLVMWGIPAGGTSFSLITLGPVHHGYCGMQQALKAHPPESPAGFHHSCEGYPAKQVVLSLSFLILVKSGIAAPQVATRGLNARIASPEVSRSFLVVAGFFATDLAPPASYEIPG